MEKLQQLVQTWRVGPIAKNRKVKSRIIRAYMTRFCISKPTADNTLNGRRTTPVDPEEVEFLKTRIDTELKFLDTL